MLGTYHDEQIPSTLSRSGIAIAACLLRTNRNKLMTYSLEKVISGKKIEILYRHGNTSVIGSLFISIIAVIIVYYFIWPADKPVDVLLIWRATFLLVSTMRPYGVIRRSHCW